MRGGFSVGRRGRVGRRSGRSGLRAGGATFAQRSSSAVLLCLCPCAPSRLAPCRLRGAVSPAVLAPARFAACRHPRFALARLRAFALAVPASVRQNRAVAVRVRACRHHGDVPCLAARCSGHRQSRPPRPPAELVRAASPKPRPTRPPTDPTTATDGKPAPHLPRSFLAPSSLVARSAGCHG